MIQKLVLAIFALLVTHLPATAMEHEKKDITIHDGTFTQSMASRSFVQIVQRATPLKATDAKELEALLQSLLDHGADINAKDDRGATALMYAACTNNKSLYRWLVHRGADGKVCNPIGKKACHMAPANWKINETSFEDEISEDNEELIKPETYDGDQCWFL